MNKHNWNCSGNCRHEVQCELDACWQRLEEALEWDNLKRAGNHPDQKKLVPLHHTVYAKEEEE